VQSSIVSEQDGMFIQMDPRGYFNKGQIHIKATLESDTVKTILLQISHKENISSLKKKIGEIMESNFELYRNLRELKATKIVKKATNTLLLDEDTVESVLVDGEEVMFELESFDQWIRVIFNMYNCDKLMIYGATEFRVDKTEQLLAFKKKLQKFAINTWSEMLRQESQLYVLDSFELKTSEEDLLGSQLLSDQQLSNASPGVQSLRPIEVNPPRKKQKLVDLRVLSRVADCKVGEVFGYKNKVFMKIVFKPVFKSCYHQNLKGRRVQTYLSDESFTSDFKPLKIASSHNTVKQSALRSSIKYLVNTQNLMVPGSRPVSRLSGVGSNKNDQGGIQLQHFRSGVIENKEGRAHSEHN